MVIHPMPKKVETAVFLALAPLWLPLVMAIFVMVHCENAIISAKRWAIGPRKEWSRWFAWHPVEAGDFETQTVWLEMVDRRIIAEQMEYRRLAA